MKKLKLLLFMLSSLVLITSNMNTIVLADYVFQDHYELVGTYTDSCTIMQNEIPWSSIKYNGVIRDKLTGETKEIMIPYLTFPDGVNYSDGIATVGTYDCTLGLAGVYGDTGDWEVRLPLKLTVAPLDSTIKCNVKNNSTMKVSKVYTTEKSKDGFDTYRKYYYEFMYVTDTIGRKVEGTFTYKGNYTNPYYGYTDLEYRFVPRDNKFETLYGNFSVYRKPNFKLTSQTNTIYVGYYNSSVHEVRVNNGKWTNPKTGLVKNLKPNTKYKITIRQKATKARKATILQNSYVTTKKAK